MKFVSKVLLCAVLLATGTSFAEEQTKAVTIQKLVDQFYQKKEARQKSLKLFSDISTRPPGYCPPGPNPGPDSACADAICEKLGHFGCDDIDEITAVGRMCRGNYDANCINTVCTKLGHFGCDDLKEVEVVARACVGNYDTSCFTNVCNKLGTFGCDDLDEIEKVLRSCSGY